MKKFWTILLRILIVASFTGVIVFTSIAFINNRNIAFDGYNYIVFARNKTDFNTLQKNVEDNVKSGFEKDADPYALFINDAIKELNEGINYSLDYLALKDNLTKGEQDKIIEGYNNYLNKFDISVSSYESYMIMYEETRKQIENDPTYTDAPLTTREIYFIERYADCYEAGSLFYKNLLELVRQYNLPENTYTNFKTQSYMIKIGLVDYSIDYVRTNMRNKNENEEYVIDARENENIDVFYEFCISSKSKSETDAFVDAKFKEFTNDLNLLNIYEWAGNFENYNKTLNESLLVKSNSTKSYFNLTFRKEN